MNSILLWLDDERNPFERDWVKNFAPEFVGKPSSIVWVVNFEEFTSWIGRNGLPHTIGFDHDLGIHRPNMSHEDILSYPMREGATGYWREPIIERMTGYDCAKWLVDYCLDKDLPLPHYFSQSSNPAGKENILGLLDNYKKFYEN